MKTIKEWWNKPITWGGYIKMSGICTLISLLFSAVFWLIMFPPKIGKKKSFQEVEDNEFEEEECITEVEES